MCDCGEIWGPKIFGLLNNSHGAKSCGHCDNPKVGQRFHSWTITKITQKRKGSGCQAEAVCDCGTCWGPKPASIITNGHSTNCGLCNRVVVGEKQGKLTATHVDLPSTVVGGRTTGWVTAVCECGESWKGRGSVFRRIHSCGCENSAGNLIIGQILTKHHVSYKKEHKLDDCRDIRHLKFDFFLPNNNICIEYQGKQHYLASCGFVKGEFTNITRRDQIKRDYCAANGITLYEIPYTYFDQLPEVIEDLVERDLMWEFNYPKIEEPTDG